MFDGCRRLIALAPPRTRTWAALVVGTTAPDLRQQQFGAEKHWQQPIDGEALVVCGKLP
jgi:hypothetical protein